MNIQDIEKYLQMIGQELHEKGQTLDILLLGGAAMLIEVGNRETTQDIDTFFLTDFVALARAAATVAKRENLHDGWFNSAAAGFTYNFIRQPDKKLWKQFPGLQVFVPSLDYLLVTKVMAGRVKDEDDIVALTERLHIASQETMLDLIRQYVRVEDIPIDIRRQIRLRFK